MDGIISQVPENMRRWWNVSLRIQSLEPYSSMIIFFENSHQQHGMFGALIVEEAGGLVLKIDKTPMTYNRKDVYNRDWYLIINRIENFLI